MEMRLVELWTAWGVIDWFNFAERLSLIWNELKMRKRAVLNIKSVGLSFLSSEKSVNAA